MIHTKLSDFLNENTENNITLYHRISNKTSLKQSDFIKSIMDNGLKCNDNGEIGNVIWFSDDYNDYGKNAKFVVSIKYNEHFKDKYDVYYDGHNGYAYKYIPFYELSVVKIPVCIVNGTTNSSDDMIRMINRKFATTDKLNTIDNVVIYAELFNKYVQPFINELYFLSKIDEARLV